MAYYTFVQNNPDGGFFDTDNLSRYVIIESDTAVNANYHAQNIGITFDKNRWEKATEEFARENPTILGRTPHEKTLMFVLPGAPYCIIHHANGVKVHYYASKVI